MPHEDYPDRVLYEADHVRIVQHYNADGSVAGERVEYLPLPDDTEPADDELPGAVDHDGPDDEHDAAVDLHTADNDHQPTTPFPDDVLIALALDGGDE